MKKKVVLLFMFLLILPINIFALEYNCELSGTDKFYSKPSDLNSIVIFRTNLYINITNIENISSFTLYVDYDEQLVGVTSCGLLNYIATPCSTTGNPNNRIIFYDYKFSNNYLEMFDKYSLYNILFLPISSTPKEGETEINVYIEDAIDKDGNPITVNSCSKKYKFAEGKLTISIDPSEKEEEQSKDNNEKDNIEDKKTETKKEETNIKDNSNNVIKDEIVKQKSNNNYAKSIKIDGYDFKFDKDKLQYTIYIDKDVNKINVNVILDDDKATYKVIGKDDLKSNDYKVLVEVVSETKEKRTYTIYTKIDDKNNNEVVLEENVDNNSPNELENDKNNINMKCIIISVILIVMVLIAVLIF